MSENAKVGFCASNVSYMLLFCQLYLFIYVCLVCHHESFWYASVRVKGLSLVSLRYAIPVKGLSLKCQLSLFFYVFLVCKIVCVLKVCVYDPVHGV
jgi:hypothetical protein